MTVLEFVAQHPWFTFFFTWLCWCGVECAIKAWRGEHGARRRPLD
jgi:hypothetical protein